jgi:uridine kinase
MLAIEAAPSRGTTAGNEESATSLKALLRSPLFLVGLAARFACLPVFGSSYLTDLFVPFLDAAVLHPGANPWSLSPPNFFPYGSVLFAILFTPRYIAYLLLGSAALGTGPLGLALVKAPLLLLDIGLLTILARFAPTRSRELLVFYWLNPVLFFISYLHGQLDLAGMAFLIFSLWLLIRRHTVGSGLAMAAATLCKFQVVLVVPLMLAYLWNRHFARPALWKIAAWGGTWAGASALGFLPVLLGGRLLYVTTGSPEAFRLFAARLDLAQGRVLYLGVAVVLTLLGRLCISTRITEKGLFFGAGVLLGSLLAVTDAAPGWFFWVFPFLSLFFATQDLAPRALYWAMVVLYLLYFLVLPELPGVSQVFTGLAFTALQTSLFASLIGVWLLVLQREMPLRGRGKPLLIGVSGDSGSGKNTLSGVLTDLFGLRQTLVIEGDDYHRWERGHDKWQDYTHLHPRANDLEDLASHTLALSEGRFIFQPHYDHLTGSLSAPREIRPARTIIVQGLHTLYPRGMRSQLDLKVFLNPDERVRLAWKVWRDVRERGHPMEKVLESLRHRRGDGEQHILPQRDLADWIIEMKPRAPITEEEVLSGREPELMVDHILWNDAPIRLLAKALGEIPECRVSIKPVEGQINRIAFHMEGTLSAEDVRAVAEQIFPSLRHSTRGRTGPVWRPGYSGLNQLVAVALIERALEAG